MQLKEKDQKPIDLSNYNQQTITAALIAVINHFSANQISIKIKKESKNKHP